MKVFILEHVHEFDDSSEDVKFIGVYSTKEKAEQAMERARFLPGFRESPEGFHIEPCEVDKDHWIEGYITVS